MPYPKMMFLIIVFACVIFVAWVMFSPVVAPEIEFVTVTPAPPTPIPTPIHTYEPPKVLPFVDSGLDDPSQAWGGVVGGAGGVRGGKEDSSSKPDKDRNGSPGYNFLDRGNNATPDSSKDNTP
jgi:hypothetical protein